MADAWRSLNKTLEPASKARGLALLGAATTWPQLVEVFEETVRHYNSGRVEICYSFEMCGWPAQIPPLVTMFNTLREQVLQWGRSQQKWATSMVASSYRLSRAYANGG